MAPDTPEDARTIPLSVMDDPDPAEDAAARPRFALTFRGYDRDDVDHFVEDLEAQLQTLAAEREQLERALAEARRQAAASFAAEAEAGHPSYRAVGERIAQIFTLAEQETDAMRAQAVSDVAATRVGAEQAVSDARSQAEDILAAARRAAAEVDAERERRLGETAQQIAELRAAEEESAAVRRSALESELAQLESAARARLTEVERQHDVVANRLRQIAAQITGPTVSGQQPAAPPEGAAEPVERTDLASGPEDVI